MTPDDHVNHGEHQPPPQPQNEQPQPLLDNATATIYLDGLIYSGYNKTSKLFEGAILTEAEGHHLVVDVLLKDENGMKTPVSHLELTHDIVKALAPFWLYVDSGKGLVPREFDAQLHTEGPQSTVNILSFEKLHERQLPPKRETYALFNFPHGVTYSAKVEPNVKLRTLAQGEVPAQAQFVRNIDVSTLTGIDIDAVSNGTGYKHLVLANKDGNNEFFRLELEQGKHYEIQILNEPIDQHSHQDPREHFLQYYELFTLRQGEKLFLVDPPIAPPPPQPSGGTTGAAPPNPPNSPPCVITLGDTEGGLRGH